MTIDTKKMSADEIRNYLLNVGGMSAEEVASIKGKGALAAKMNEKLGVEVEHDDPFDALETEIVSKEAPTETNEGTPSYGSDDWCAYVMSQFKADELFDGRPTIGGLRRLTQKLVGTITKSIPTNVFMVGERAICVWETSIIPHGYMPHITYTYGGTADSVVQNTDGVFGMFPVAMAEVRAEGRALKRALQITVATADEVSKENAPKFLAELLKGTETNAEWTGNDMINDTQTILIEKMCNRLELDVQKVVELSPKGYKSLKDMTKEGAAKLIEVLNKWQQKPEDIVDSVRKV